MGINQSGKLAVLAARRGFLVVDFDDLANPRKLTHLFKWEPGPLQWNPHKVREVWLTRNIRYMVFVRFMASSTRLQARILQINVIDLATDELTHIKVSSPQLY